MVTGRYVFYVGSGLGPFAGIGALDKMSPPTGKEKTSNFRK
jgi:hypothetical protein